jgi:hypothetical protein
MATFLSLLCKTTLFTWAMPCLFFVILPYHSDTLYAQTQRRNTNSTNTTADPADPPVGQLPRTPTPARRSTNADEPRRYAPTAKGIRLGAFVQAKFTDNLATTPTDIQTSFLLNSIPDIGLSLIIPLQKDDNTWSAGCDIGYAGYGITHDRLNVVLAGITMPRLVGSRTYRSIMIMPKIFYHAVYAGLGFGIPLGGNATRSIPGQVIDLAPFRALGDAETFGIAPGAMPVIVEARIGADATIYRDDTQEVLIGAMASIQLNTLNTDGIVSLSTFSPRMIGLGVRLSYGFTIAQ